MVSIKVIDLLEEVEAKKCTDIWSNAKTSLNRSPLIKIHMRQTIEDIDAVEKTK